MIVFMLIRIASAPDSRDGAEPSGPAAEAMRERAVALGRPAGQRRRKADR
jgi:hypothetical protein